MEVPRPMSLLERLRAPRPAWQHPDPVQRAEAVRQIPGHEQTLLAEIARGDADGRVRRAAQRKLSDPRTLVEVLAGEVDATAREEAAEAFMAWASGEDAASARVALEALSDPRRLAHVARAARLAPLRQAALERLEDPRLLATLAKLADDPGIRGAALARLREPASIVDVASKAEHKDVAVAAVDRIEDVQVLREIAQRARHRAASRRAVARLAARGAAAPAVAVETVDGGQTAEPLQEAAADRSDEPAAMAEPAQDADVTPEPAEAPDATPEAQGPADTEAAAGESAASAEPPDAPAPEAPASEPRPAAQAAAAPRKPGQELPLVRALALCDLLEALARRPELSLRESERALRDARQLQAISGELSAKLLHRLKDARSALFARAQELREADEWSRWGNAAVQEELCGRLEALREREDFERVARELREADERWARFRHAPKDQAEPLRQRYQAARAQVKPRLDAYFAQKTTEEKQNLQEKRTLCEQAEQWAESTEWLKGSDALKALQARWKAVGAVPHRQSEVVWQRFRTACDRFFKRRDENLRQRKSEWAANLARKQGLCERAEALSGSSDWEPAAAEIKRLQAEWKTVGPVRKAKADAIWHRFRAACDAFFERYKNRDALEQAQKAAQREALCAELEALLPAEGREPPDTSGLYETLGSLQARWRQAPRLAPEPAAAFERRFAELRARVIAAWPEALRGTDLDLDVARARKEKLLARVEGLLPAEPAVRDSELSGEALARRLKDALAGNTIGGAAEAEARRRAAAEEVETARAAWLRLPALSGEAGEALERRFAEACARFPREKPAEREAPRPGPRGRPPREGRPRRAQR